MKITKTQHKPTNKNRRTKHEKTKKKRLKRRERTHYGYEDSQESGYVSRKISFLGYFKQMKRGSSLSLYLYMYIILYIYIYTPKRYYRLTLCQNIKRLSHLKINKLITMINLEIKYIIFLLCNYDLCHRIF